jgi:serine/threonine protein kinase
VYPIDKTIKVTHINFAEFGYTQPQVVKIQLHCSCGDGAEGTSCIKHNPKKSLQNEVYLAQKVPHLNCQRPVMHLERSCTRMNKLPGKDLFTILKQDELRETLLSLQQRMDLSLAILKALKTQVTDQGIIHRDIKPENILVHLGTTLNVGIIDYGHAIEMPNGTDIYNHDRCGTLVYVAPEVLSSTTSDNGYLQTPAMDLFSIARVLVLIWGGCDQSYSYKHSTIYWYYLHSEHFKQITPLFSNISRADHDILKKFELNLKIHDFLKRLLSLPPKNRGDIDTAISLFGSILEEFTQKISPPIASVPSTLFSTKKSQPLSTNHPIKKAHSYTEGSTSPKTLFFPCASKTPPIQSLAPGAEEHEASFSTKRRKESDTSNVANM